MKSAVLVFAILLLCAPVFAQDLYVNFNGVAAGTPASLAIMSTIGKTNGNAVTPSYVGTSTGISVENSPPFPGLLSPVTIAGIPYTNTTPTRALYVQPDVGGDGNLQKLMWTYAASRKVSCGFSITMTNFGSAANDFYNCGGFETGGTYGVISMVADNGVPYIQSETIGGTGSDVLIGGNGTSALTIWVTMLWDSANSKFICSFYNQTNMTLMGYSTMAITLNSTVNTMGWGGTASHTYAAGENYWLNNLILYTNGAVWPVWPGGNLQVPTNSSGTAVTAAIAAASDGDTIILPATNQTWTSAVNLNKNRISLHSVLRNVWGSNQTKITISGAITDPNAAIIVSGYMNVLTNFMIRGAGVSEEADGISVPTGSLSNVFAFLHMENLAVPFNVHDGCLIKYCNTLNNDFVLGRDNRSVTYYNNNTPLAKTSLKHAVFETSLATWNNSKLDGGAEAGFSSQVGAAWIIRDCDFALESSGVNPAPGFDAHGESPGLSVPILSGILISNRFTRTTAWNGKFVDVRSPNVWVLYNVVTGVDVLDGVYVRNEDPPFPISNCYIKGNFDGVAGNVAMTVQNDGSATAGVDYLLTDPPDSSMVANPHPWWVAIAAGTWPDPAQPDNPSSPPNPPRGLSGRASAGGRAVLQ